MFDHDFGRWIGFVEGFEVLKIFGVGKNESRSRREENKIDERELARVRETFERTFWTSRRHKMTVVTGVVTRLSKMYNILFEDIYTFDWW